MKERRFGVCIRHRVFALPPVGVVCLGMFVCALSLSLFYYSYSAVNRWGCQGRSACIFSKTPPSPPKLAPSRRVLTRARTAAAVSSMLHPVLAPGRYCSPRYRMS